MNITKSQFDIIKSHFPYDPYPPQAEYMKDVFSIVENEKIGLLEAPSGFGKTSALLASTVIFSEDRVYYYSRTHAQMKQVAQELMKINEKSGNCFSCVVRGSRNQLCLDKETKKEKDHMKMAEICLSRLKRVRTNKVILNDFYVDGENRAVTYEAGLPELNIYCDSELGRIEILSSIPEDIPIIADINALRKYGLKKKICPYFLARLLAKSQDIVVGSYKYLFYDNFYQDQIVILDEAHNIEQLCKEGVSFSLSQGVLNQALYEIKEIERDWASSLEEIFLNLVMAFKHAEFKDGELLSMSQFLTTLAENGVYIEHIKYLVDNWHLIQNCWTELKKIRKKFILIDNLKLMWVYNFFENFINSPKNSYRGIWSVRNNNPTLSWYCLDAEIAFNQIKNVKPKTVILTSGTLSPQKNIANRLGMENPFMKSYPAVFPENNVQVLVLNKGKNKVPLTTAYRERNNPEITREYGNTIISIINKIPNGSTVFFPSYYLMHNMLNFWRKEGFFDDLKASIFIESRDMTSNIYDHYSKEASKRKAALFAVMRGKLSEGQNFPDEIGRAVLIIGIPYPNTQDPRLKAQREYYEKKEKGMGYKWYNDETFNTVNQTLGRVWRHKGDYAIGFLLDYRYQNNLKHLPFWLAGRTTIINPYTPFSTVEKIIQNFFADR
ncbi:MAG: helicase C-terminal domain-containing protein [Candidatus Helarchaeota archaeon]